MSPEDSQENSPENENAEPNESQDPQRSTDVPSVDYVAGRRSITTRGAVSRRQMVEEKRQLQLKSRPFIIAAAIVLIGLLVIPVYAYFQIFVFPPRELALRVADTEYTRGDVVNFIRFNQRMSEDLGVPFEIGNSLFEALLTLQENELAFQLAPQYGIAVSPEEVDDRVDFILGFVATTVAERESREYKDNIEEAKRQFIHRIGMDEDVFRDFIRKSMFKERLRAVIAEEVDRVQVQVHLYEIILINRDSEIQRAMERDLRGGDSVEEVALRYSDDPNVQRNRGDRGWFPFGVSPELDALLFGLDADGNRILALRTPSEGRYDETTRTYSYVIVDEVNDAREVDVENLDALTTRAMTIFLNEERGNFDLYMVLDSEIFDWVNKQVRLSTILTPPTPVPFDAQFGGLSQLEQ